MLLVRVAPRFVTEKHPAARSDMTSTSSVFIRLMEKSMCRERALDNTSDTDLSFCTYALYITNKRSHIKSRSQ